MARRLTTEQKLRRVQRQTEVRAKVDAGQEQLTYEDAVDANPADLLRAINQGQMTEQGYGPRKSRG